MERMPAKPSLSVVATATLPKIHTAFWPCPWRCTPLQARAGAHFEVDSSAPCGQGLDHFSHTLVLLGMSVAAHLSRQPGCCTDVVVAQLDAMLVGQLHQVLRQRKAKQPLGLRGWRLGGHQIHRQKFHCLFNKLWGL